MRSSKVDSGWQDQSKIPLEDRIYCSLEALRIDFGVEHVGAVVSEIDWEPFDKAPKIEVKNNSQNIPVIPMTELKYVVTAYKISSTLRPFYKLVKV